eukprot:TRINITY_DN11667_c0_g1_i1.p1 TRINITY_DN11667_c0_g1~~TRINITY_DN11667_c0_g1_i1.p1  ORF type:complete len:183 (-),score=24.20 TRINITY_DN11667_c0_g1_i1:56-604(-)
MVENLPTEITVQILSHLKMQELLKLETVCKSFQNVVSNYMQEINFTSNVEDKHLVNFFVRHNNVRSINLKKCNKITNKTLRSISVNCMKLTRINLTQCNLITDAGLLELVKCQELQRIDLTGCTEVTSAALVKLMKQCTNLQSLHLRGCPVYNQWTKKELKTLSTHFPKVSLYPKRTLTTCK